MKLLKCEGVSLICSPLVPVLRWLKSRRLNWSLCACTHVWYCVYFNWGLGVWCTGIHVFLVCARPWTQSSVPKEKIKWKYIFVFLVRWASFYVAGAILRIMDAALDSGTSLSMFEKLIENGTVPTLLSSKCWDWTQTPMYTMEWSNTELCH